MEYTADDVLRVARRHNNEKRSYLLVNPLQGKHMPVSPSLALDMMQALGAKVAKAVPHARLVIGFAETATAIGAVVAKSLADSCLYVQTTRETLPAAAHAIEFMEEHSHAPEQRIAAAALEAHLAETEAVVFVDDELSTGRTLLNIIDQLKAALPALAGKKIIAASVINRLTAKRRERLFAAGVECVFLVGLAQGDYEAQAAAFPTQGAAETEALSPGASCRTVALSRRATPRMGLPIGDYMAFWRAAGESFAAEIDWAKDESILVLGTEECMLPGLLIGKVLEDEGCESGAFHATTRSPIGISEAAGYPIAAGRQVKSFYGDARRTYIYNLRPYRHVVVVSDTAHEAREGLESLLRVLREAGCKDVLYLMSRES